MSNRFWHGNGHIWGDKGRNTFVLAAGEGTDTIIDFQIGKDLLGLTDERALYLVLLLHHVLR
jgi:hypothetical protein